MLARHHDPIAAIATAPGRGAVGIVRISGKAIAPIMKALCGKYLVPRQASYLPFRDAQGLPIDQGLALFFPAPNSFTGEDVLELQAHGGPVVLQLLLARCLQAATETDATTGQPRLPGLRVASNNAEQEEAVDELDIDYAGDAIEIGFNVTYLIDALTNMEQDMVKIELADSNSSALLTIPDDAAFKYVVMPMRI